MGSFISTALAVVAGRWRWRKARTMADLAKLRAQRIPVWPTAPAADVEGDQRMLEALFALGGAGFVVLDFRPGRRVEATDDLPSMATRACVVGFADDETKDWLDNLLYYAGKEPGAVKYTIGPVYDLYAPGQMDYDRWDGSDEGRSSGVWVERIDGNPTYRIGGQMNAREVYRAFPTRRSVQKELRRAWLVGIASPTWGDQRMFADLSAMLRDPGLLERLREKHPDPEVDAVLARLHEWNDGPSAES